MLDSPMIRPFQPDDSSQVIHLWRATVTTCSPWNDPDYVVRRKLLQGDGLFFVAERADHIVGVGSQGLTEDEKCKIGYWLAQSHWGQGIMTAVVKSLCGHLFDAYRLRRIYANVFGDNNASGRVLERCGFQHEGTRRQHTFRNGEPVDLHSYGLLR